MKTQKKSGYGMVILLLGTMLSLFVLTGCVRSNNSQTANELHFSLDNISEVAISYDEEPITFYQAEGSELVVKEYMTKNMSRYYAEVRQEGGRIQIREGGKPFPRSGFTRYVEVYFPETYHGNLTVTTTDGMIDLSEVALELSSLRIDSTAGTVHIECADASVMHLSSTSGVLDLGRITGGQIRLETTSGNIKCEELNGTVTYTSTSGDIEVKSAVGSGSYRANNSGTLHVIYSEVTGDLTFYNKNDHIKLELPKDLDFEFEAAMKNGSVFTTFQDHIQVGNGTAYGTVGSSPTVTIKTETKNGQIEVTQ